MRSPSSRFLLLVASLLLCERSVVQAQQLRTIPNTPDNQEFFALTQSLFMEGVLSTSSCDSQRSNIEQCIRTCNSPGPRERNGCCCVIDNSNSTSKFYIGLRGGCRYNQRLLKFTDSFIYESSPINSNMPFFDQVTCASTAENANDNSCTCTLVWEASASELAEMPPIPTPSPSSSPSPVTSPTMSTSTLPSMEPTVTPAVDPTISSAISPPVEPAGPPTVITPPNGITTPTPTDVSTPLPTEDSGFGPAPGGNVSPTAELDPSPSPDDDSVCVDQKYLLDRGFSAEHLVHNGGISSTVLCPQHSQLPCASLNHKVRFNGVDMSYRQLCEHEVMACQRDEMLVNSVFSHLWDEARHGEVMLTMFDTRYAEVAQKGLHSVMHALRTVRKRVV
ncbi:unnamed protein product [Agarophyton chilense]